MTEYLLILKWDELYTIEKAPFEGSYEEAKKYFSTITLAQIKRQLLADIQEILENGPPTLPTAQIEELLSDGMNFPHEILLIPLTEKDHLLDLQDEFEVFKQTIRKDYAYPQSKAVEELEQQLVKLRGLIEKALESKDWGPVTETIEDVRLDMRSKLGA